MGFPRQEYQSGLPFHAPGDPANPGIKPPKSPALAGGFFTTEPPGKHLTSIAYDSAISDFFQSRDGHWNMPFKAHEVRGVYV